MHLFIVTPALDRLWHLHPDEITTGAFEARLPDLPQGQYELFADLVHRTGVSETVTGQLDTPAIRGVALTGDDSEWSSSSSSTGDVSQTPDGGRIVWVRDGQALRDETADDVHVSRGGRGGSAGQRSGALYGDARTRHLRAARPACVRPCASVWIGADGRDGNRDAIQPAARASRRGCPRRFRFPMDFQSRGTIGSSCR